MALLLGSGALVATLLGGSFALLRRDRLNLILGFSAGAVIGVALFDLLPEATDLGGRHHEASTVALLVGVGFFAYLVLDRVVPHSSVGAASLSLHSFLDGVGIGLAFKVSASLGVVVAAAVLAHDFSDGLNTVTVVLRNRGRGILALRWLVLDAVAPLLGVASTFLYTVSEAHLALVLALFCGFFLYLGASDLIPASHRRSPQRLTAALNVAGAGAIWLAIHFASI